MPQYPMLELTRLREPKRRGRPRAIIEASKVPGVMPLDYMLSVIRDPNATQDRRDRMAIAAAPYCHPRISDAVRGKKDQQAEAADMAGIGTPWVKDLEFEDRAN